ncbi:MAG: hypothetical protein HY700_01625 [Gemmatimonadetes bacterium]|nr:hypothetical protein [Gemmatimonadota bacterium]
MLRYRLAVLGITVEVPRSGKELQVERAYPEPIMMIDPVCGVDWSAHVRAQPEPAFTGGAGERQG